MKLYEKNDKRNPNGASKTQISLCFRMALIKELTKRLHSYGASKFNVLPCFAACILPTNVKMSLKKNTILCILSSQVQCRPYFYRTVLVRSSENSFQRGLVDLEMLHVFLDVV